MALAEKTLLIFYVRNSRIKAMDCAIQEALFLLRDFEPVALPGGPMGDTRGLFWIEIPSHLLNDAADLLPRLGYSYAVDFLEYLPGVSRPPKSKKSVPNIVRWRGDWYQLTRIYEEDEKELRDRAPDRRLFAIETEEDDVRLIRGYRGDGGDMSRRGLAVHDARMLVNLVHTKRGATFLDPFAGVGGIVLEAIDSGYRVFSCDNDPILRPGLERFGSIHYVCDSRQLPFDDESIDIIATEPPYDPKATPVVVEALSEMFRVLKPGGKLSMLCALHQAEALSETAKYLRLETRFETRIDRKGMDCAVFAWEKPVW